METIREPKVLRDLWDVKENAWKRVAHLEFDDAIRKRLDDSRRRTLELGFHLVRKKR